MPKQRQIELLAGSIAQAEDALFLERMEERFWQYQALASKQYNQILGAVQTKIRILENKIPFLKDKLKEIEEDSFNYDSHYQK